MDSITRVQELDRLRTRSSVQYFTEESSDDSGSERGPGPSSRGRKIRKVESNIPQIVHLTWLNKQCYGTIPRERFTNVISLAKQFKANGWHVKIWTNNPMILHRAGACLGAGAEGQNRGLALESHFMEGKDSRGKGKMKYVLIRNCVVSLQQSARKLIEMPRPISFFLTGIQWEANMSAMMRERLRAQERAVSRLQSREGLFLQNWSE